ncbi:hypothetical protein L1049_004095 [Liquidambar formosana]|uniref:Uncharacterized protein n=1 Tax=Liquidambar formosana TaxID=63359 RepID=A0AAP0WZY9_LIQFO
MDVGGRRCRGAVQSEEEMDIRKGPWTEEEDSVLTNYISIHGEGHWNTLARCAGLKRTGKSCRLRWLNYLHPDLRRGNITLQEQLLILELHSRWGNRWSKIAQHLPGRTDNEIKNYWRTRVQKQAKQLKCDVNSKQFRDTMRHVWIPRLLERIRAASESSMGSCITTTIINQTDMSQGQGFNMGSDNDQLWFGQVHPTFKPEISGCSSDSLETQVSPVSDLTGCYDIPGGNFQYGSGFCQEFAATPAGCYKQGMGFQASEQSNGWSGCGDSFDNMLNDEDIWFLQQHLNGDEI